MKLRRKAKFGRAIASHISSFCPSALAPKRSGELRATNFFMNSISLLTSFSQFFDSYYPQLPIYIFRHYLGRYSCVFG